MSTHGSCVNVVLTTTHLFTVKTQEARGTSLSAEADTDRSRAIVLKVFRSYYPDLENIIARDHNRVARQLYAMAFLSSEALVQITSQRSSSRDTFEDTEQIMIEIEYTFRFNPTPPYELMVQFCEMIKKVSYRDHYLPEAIMRTLGELVNVILHNF